MTLSQVSVPFGNRMDRHDESFEGLGFHAMTKTKQSVELATLQWVSWFNRHRLMGPLGNVPPVEFDAKHHQQRVGQAATA